MDYFDDISVLDWAILDALADDYESISLIHETIITSTNLKPTKREILDRIEFLYQKHYLSLTEQQAFNKDDLIAEVEDKTKDQKYWFGCTDRGSNAWLGLTDKYKSKAIPPSSI